MSILLAILGLGLLVVVHEAGHYLVARWSNMRVERFSIGFGPALLSWKSGETQFQLAPIPFGGFVQIVGMNPHEEFDERDPRVYPNRPPLLRFLTILAGPAMNYVLASVMVFAVTVGEGAETGELVHRVRSVQTDSAAQAAGFRSGDKIRAVDGVAVTARLDEGETDPHGGRPDFRKLVQASAGKTLTVRVERGGRPVDLQVSARLVTSALAEPAAQRAAAALGLPKPEPMYRLGVELETERVRTQTSVAGAAVAALEFPITMSGEILSGLRKIITREVSAEVRGPVGIVDDIQVHMSLGWVRALEVLAMLSVYLGLFNLLPLPGLDGGRLAFLTYELATRRRPNPRVEATVHMFGILLFFVLLILVTFKDIRRLF
jgi:regulator of sigma E protease